jgi:hypothetical protein
MSEKSSDPQEEYFAKLNREKVDALAHQLAAEKAEAEKIALKQLHYLRCGKCGGQMKPREFRGVEIDVCSSCNAVLLDPGELETLAGKDSTGVIGSLASLFSFNR